MKTDLRVLDDLDDRHEARAVIRALVPIPPEDESPTHFQAFIAQVKPNPAIVMKEEEQASGCDKPQKPIVGGGNRHL
ncbi:MAG: hypothetical protein ACU0B9_11255 [Limimaricola soesokkakensis]|uniref:hypothetical protein n=1 Tax=Limimaricola soesokkakensis TaxID=1343159 RepID=UPI00405A069D